MLRGGRACGRCLHLTSPMVRVWKPKPIGKATLTAPWNLRAATWRSAEAGGQGHDLTVETIKAVMAAGLAGIALLYAAGQPADARAPGRPFDEGVDSGRQRGFAAVLAMMDDKRAR